MFTLWTGMPALRGEDNVLVRPYLLAHEQQEEARRRQARRRALRFAVHGIDLGPRVLHDVEVARWGTARARPGCCPGPAPRVNAATC
ncbi:hypothetical protein ACFW5I_00945 [Streptomyces sp. NPDC058818]|uniref:hypothetical protein n=1 Tax=Streptomyces sp. NPDC058818 TaxID=3346640 RepID=UPI0036D126E4